MKTAAKNTSGREIVISRVIAAPRALVWEAWTNPALVVKWWGPRGFTNTTKRHEFRVGGAWEHVMHGPDGTNYPNKSIFKEILPQERIVFSHGGGREDGEIPGTNFTATWTFEIVDAEKTKVTGRLLFSTAAARDHVVREFGAIEGSKQTLERLSEQIAAMRSEPFVIAREFDAPRDLVWRVWTEREHFTRWFGPKGFKMNFPKFDLRSGGMMHYSMLTPDGKEMWGKALYREIAPPEKIVYVNSFSDKNGGITAHPMSPSWPLQLLTVITLVEKNGQDDRHRELASARCDTHGNRDLQRRPRRHVGRLGGHVRTTHRLSCKNQKSRVNFACVNKFNPTADVLSCPFQTCLEKNPLN